MLSGSAPYPDPAVSAVEAGSRVRDMASVSGNTTCSFRILIGSVWMLEHWLAHGRHFPCATGDVEALIFLAVLLQQMPNYMHTDT